MRKAMKKREIEKTENLLLSQIEVSDGVLDKARAELAERQEKTESSPVKRKKYIAAAVACALVCVILVPVIYFSAPSNNGGSEPVYRLEELDRREIPSIGGYNDEYAAHYYRYPEATETAYAYSYGGKDILLAETFSYRSEECVWYVLTDTADSVDILQDFYGCTATETVNGFQIYYDLAAGKAYFAEDGSAYFLSARTDHDGLTEILSLILTH